MPYDQQGNFYGSDEDLGALEAKYTKPDYASQIPGQVTSSRSEEPKSLREKAALALTQANPLMVGKSLQDMTKTLVGGAALPVVAPVSAGVQYLNALPGNLLRRSRGEEEVKTPSAEDLMRKYGEAIAPQTPAGQNFQEGVGKLMETLKVPHAWPLTPAGPRRPMLTPTDVRVGAGQVKQLAKELRETPADFQAAQSGLKRQNLYGEDTIGVKAQAAADALGDTLERRQASGKSLIPGIPEALTPETKLYAVRPKGTRMVQAKVPESAKGYKPDVNALGEIVEDVYGDTPAAQMPPDMVMAEYAKRFLPPDSELLAALKNYSSLKAQEMFPDASTPREAQQAYDVLYSDRAERNKQQLADIEEFLTNVVPEYRQNVPTPSEFMQRMGEAERVIKGPFTTFISKNVGAEGDPTVKLARQGITFETPENIRELSQFADKPGLAKRRLEAGFPAMGSFHEERMAKTGELERLNSEIEALEEVRQPLFNRAHDEGIDPASIPEYAETTNPLRQKLRQREQLQGELENIKLAQDVENIGDFAVDTKTKQEMLDKIPFPQRQFYPGVTKAAEGEKLYAGRKTIFGGMGFDKLGKELVEDILTGKAGDTSKLTIENYMRDKGLSRLEAEKAAKLQQQQYRETLQNTLLDRIKNDQNVKMIGNAAIITLDANTPRDVAMRDMSADTVVLDHCVGQCGTAPQGRKNILSGQQQYYEPVIDPITGERNARGTSDTGYVRDLQNGHELVSVRDAKTGLPAATLELIPSSDGRFRIGFASGAKNKAIDPAYVPALRDYLNSRAADIYSPGGNLSDNAGIFDSTSPAEFKRVAREAGLTNDQVKAVDWGDLPRFVTVDDVKEMAKGIKSASQELAVRDEGPLATLTTRDYEVMTSDFNAAFENALETALDSSNLDRPERVESAVSATIQTIFDNHLNDPVAFTEEGVTRLRRAERDIRSAIENAYAQQTDLQSEKASVLEDFLIDVRGIRSNIERRLSANEARAREQAQVPVVQAQGDAMPQMSADDLLQAHGDRMTREQQQWLESFVQNWENNVDDTPAGQGLAEQLTRLYDGWLAENRLQPDPLANLFDNAGDWEPDPTAVANRPADANLNARENELYRNYVDNFNRNMRDGLITEEWTSEELANFVREGDEDTGTPNLTQAERTALASLIEQHGIQEGFEPYPEAVANRPAQLAPREAVPREIQVMAVQDLAQGMTPAWNRQAQELADTYFGDNVIDGNNVTISALTNMIRNYRAGPHADAPYEVRELAARRLEGMHNQAMMDAEQIADTINEAFYDDAEGPEEARTMIRRDIRLLEENGERAWEDLVGPMIEDYPWSSNLQYHLIQYLRNMLDLRQDFAKGGLVKKKRKAKKPTMALVVTRKNPELAEMTYRYGGMVR